MGCSVEPFVRIRIEDTESAAAIGSEDRVAQPRHPAVRNEALSCFHHADAELDRLPGVTEHVIERQRLAKTWPRKNRKREQPQRCHAAHDVDGRVDFRRWSPCGRARRANLLEDSRQIAGAPFERQDTEPRTDPRCQPETARESPDACACTLETRNRSSHRPAFVSCILARFSSAVAKACARRASTPLRRGAKVCTNAQLALVMGRKKRLATTTRTSAEGRSYWLNGMAMSTTALSNRPTEIAWPVVGLMA